MTENPHHALHDERTGALGCDHPDQALVVAEYFIGEMRKNVFSSDAFDIREWNRRRREMSRPRSHFDSNNRDIFARVRRPPPAGTNFDIHERSLWLRAGGLWAWKVMPFGEWDYKNNGDLWKREEFVTTYSTNWHHKYGEYEYYYDIWGNIHYGYIGMFSLFGKMDLLDNAGSAQIMSDYLTKGHKTNYAGVPDPKDRHYDDVTDQISIRIGIELFEDFPNPYGITPAELMRRIEEAPYPVRAASKIRHDCSLYE